MKPKLAPALLAFLISTALPAACPMHPDAPPELSANHDCCRIAQENWEATLAARAPSALSLYQVESRWQNQDGDSAPLAQLAGRSQLVAMAYTTCEYACPRLLADLKAIETQLAEFKPADLGITLITFDPARDTAARFREYAQINGLDLRRWTLLRADPSDTLELANLLGVRYKSMPNGEITHSNIITLLNPRGEIVTQIDGLGADAEPLLVKLAAQK